VSVFREDDGFTVVDARLALGSRVSKLGWFGL
jgi:hypothetical protein